MDFWIGITVFGAGWAACYFREYLWEGAEWIYGKVKH